VAGRRVRAAFGALAGLCIRARKAFWTATALPEPLLIALTAFGVAVFGGALAMSGPLRWPRAALGAAFAAAATAALRWHVSPRFASAEQMASAAHPPAAAFAPGALPLPSWIAAQGPGRRDGPTVFGEARAMAVRAEAAGPFTGLVRGLILLSGAMPSRAGRPVIEDILLFASVPWLSSGGIAGLAPAVMDAPGDNLAPDVPIRLLRLRLPAVLAAVALLAVALPVQGFSASAAFGLACGLASWRRPRAAGTGPPACGPRPRRARCLPLRLRPSGSRRF
jgi:hypothetical protein